MYDLDKSQSVYDYDTIKKELPDLLIKAREALEKIDEDKKTLKHSVELQIEHIKSDMERYEIKEFSIVFMGKPGCGKTTSIVNLFDFLPDKLKKMNTHGGKGVQLPKASLFPVGSGATTAADTIEIIKLDDLNHNSFFEVECCSKEEMENQLLYYVEKQYVTELQTYLRDNPDKNSGKKYDMEEMPQEISRYIENMCAEKIKYKSISGDNDYPMKKDAEDKFQPQKLGALVRYWIKKENAANSIFDSGEIDSDVVEKYEKKILSELIDGLDPSIEKGEKKIIEYINKDDEGQDITIRDFIRITMDKLNKGTYSGLTIVRKIKLFLNPNELPFAMHCSNGDYEINRVVDTRGYSEKKTRVDLKEYLSKPENINIITEKYVDCPGGKVEVANAILKNHISANVKMGWDAVMINWETGEPSSNVDNKTRDDDEDDDFFEELDVSEKKLVLSRNSQVKGFLVRNFLNFNKDNVFDYNPLTGYTIQNAKIVGYNESEAEDERVRVQKLVFDMIDREKASILLRIYENYSLLRRFVENGDINISEYSETIIEKVFSFSKELMNKVIYEIQNKTFKDLYLKHIQEFGNRCYKPLANHSGKYEGLYGTVSLYDNFSGVMQEYYIKHINYFGNQVYQEIIKCTNELQEAKDSKDLIRLLNNCFEQMVKELANYGEDIEKYYSSILNENDFFGSISPIWTQTQNRAYRGGMGVNLDIEEMFVAWVSRENNDGLYGSFNMRSKGIEESITKTLMDIIYDSFGRR